MHSFNLFYYLCSMNSKERIGRILSLGLYDKMTTPNLPDVIDKYVAAGNPGKSYSKFPAQLPLPHDFTIGKKSFHMEDYFRYIVSGNSMSPEGIFSGCELLASPVEDSRKISTGDYMVITVDKEFYKFRHHNRTPYFVQKLRKAIMPVSPTDTFEQLTSNLVDTFAEPFTNKEKKDLRDSLDEARKFYDGRELYISVTYHDGNIHYSFHPIENIRYKVDFVAYPSQKEPVVKEVSELYN